MESMGDQDVTSPQSHGPPTGNSSATTRKPQLACDVCRSRKVKCQYAPNASQCNGCIFLGTSCTHNRPRRKRGPANRHAAQYAQAGDPGAVRSPSQPVSTPHNSSEPDPQRRGSFVTSTPGSWAGPDALPGNTTWLTQLAPPELIMRAVNDWFDHIHSVAPILHRRRFLSRLYDGEAEKNPLFSGLVISVCAAAVATLKRSDYDQLTVDRCLQVVETHQLLAQRSTKAQYSLDWCIAMYNLGTASATLTAIDDVWAYHAGSQSAAGARYLAYYCLEQLPLVEKEMLKRLFWLLVAWACSCDLFGRLSIGLLTHQEKLAQLRPLVLTDRELDTESYCSPHSVSPWSGDDTSYVPGLNHLSDLFMIWHEAQTTPNIQPNETLQRYTERVQATIDGLPPSIRWRGGLSRPAAVTSLHDVQVVNLYISALHIRSNLLQKFGTQSAVDHVAAEHQRIIDDLLEILYHMPQAVFDANGSSVVPKVRDIGAAYLEQLSLQHVPAGDGAREKIERLLWKLDTLDFRPAVAFLRGERDDPGDIASDP